MLLKSVMPLVLTFHLISAERVQSCTFYSKKEGTHVTEYCDLFLDEKCCQGGCCSDRNGFPWWAWTVVGTSIFCILFCWCFLKMCMKKKRKQPACEDNDDIPLETLKEEDNSGQYKFVYRTEEG